MLNWFHPGEHERLSRGAALAVTVAAAAVCLLLLVRLVWLLVPRADDAGAAPAATAPASPAPVLSVAKWHLFGNAQAPAPSAAASLATVLKLGLRGTLALADPKDERALAIITNEQGVEASFRIGATVAPGATLAEVYTDHVILDHGGIAESLSLPTPEQHAPPLPETNQQNLARAAPPAPNVPRGIRSAAPPAAAAAAPATANLDPNELVRQIRPVLAGGRIVGADISGADAGLLARAGLKPSDIVTAINGTPLANVSNPQALIDQLQNSRSIQVTVQRDGKPATLTLSLR